MDKSSCFCSAWQPCSSSFQTDQKWTKKLCCCGTTLWNSLPLTVHNPLMSLTQSASEDRAVLQSLWNTAIAPLSLNLLNTRAI